MTSDSVIVICYHIQHHNAKRHNHSRSIYYTIILSSSNTFAISYKLFKNFILTQSFYTTSYISCFLLFFNQVENHTVSSSTKLFFISSSDKFPPICIIDSFLSFSS